ncbi:hypothetical protein ACIG47_08620 [Promicromonospora sp. NPDC052451]|uniref:hypothetical protein n=1 Tax=Promicromonospora sp. NPDC052451 TaxID=3364407 RepID=UPI0037CCB83B
MTEAAELTPEMIQSKWSEIAPLIDRMMERIGTSDEFPVQAGSSLSGDDSASSPYHASHVLRMCLTAGVDHLHAAKVLVVDQQVLHLAAPSSLARGALENFAAAYWILGPAKRDERIERALRWHYKNVSDQHTALADLAVLKISREAEMAKIDAVALRRGFDPKPLRSGYTSTFIVKYCESELGDRVPLGVVLPWRICSGLAHGRPWAYMGVSETMRMELTDGIVLVKLTSSLSMALFPLLASMYLLQEFLKLHELRARKHYG